MAAANTDTNTEENTNTDAVQVQMQYKLTFDIKALHESVFHWTYSSSQYSNSLFIHRVLLHCVWGIISTGAFSAASPCIHQRESM